MITDRYLTLAAQYLDDDIGDADARELGSILTQSPEARRHFRKQTLVAELLSQQYDPSRSERSFLESLKAREEYSADGSRFVSAVEARIREDGLGGRPRRARRPLARSARRGGRLWALVSMAACAAAAAVLLTYLHDRPAGPAPELVRAEILEGAPGTRIERGEASMSAQAGMILVLDDAIHTGDEGGAKLRYRGERTTVDLRSDTVLVLGERAGAAVLRLRAGGIECSVQRQRAGTSVRVITPHAEVSVVGTRFDVGVDAASTRVEVRAGRVLVTCALDDSHVALDAGQSVTVSESADTGGGAVKHADVLLEAEDASDVHGAFERGTDDAASGGAFMYAPASAGMNIGGKGDPVSWMALRVRVPLAGAYRMWLRGTGPDGHQDSFWIRMDEAAEQTNGAVPVGAWGWMRVPGEDGIRLDAGEHRLVVRLREGGARLDRILLTTREDYEPGGAGER